MMIDLLRHYYIKQIQKHSWLEYELEQLLKKDIKTDEKN
jgi:hypothetical protein